jgi:AcrR family transcriptional regulator
VEKQRSRRAKLRGEERKKQIIRAAMDVFARYGFRGTTIRKLARRAGVCEAMIYHHFPSKEALYDAMLQQKIEDSRHLFFPVDAAHAKQDRKVFETIVGNFLRQQSHDNSFMRMLLFSALEGHDLAHKFVEEPLQDFFQFLGSYLEQRAEEGAWKPLNGQVSARLLMGMVYYFTLLREIFRDPAVQDTDLEDLVQTTVDLFCHGLRGPDLQMRPPVPHAAGRQRENIHRSAVTAETTRRKEEHG